MGFHCSRCNEEHEGFPHVGFANPYYFFTVPEEERAHRCERTSDTCAIDNEDRFIRGILPIPVHHNDDSLAFAFGAWMSVSETNLEAYVRFGNGELDEAPWMAGYLSSEIPGFPSCLELVVGTQPTDPDERPVIEMAPGDHPLVKLHYWGIPEVSVYRG